MAGAILKSLQSVFGEMICSFVFGFAVYSAILGSKETEQAAGGAIVGLTVAFSAVAVIYAFCDVAVAHFNPAITLTAILTGKLPIIRGLGYILAQYVGFTVSICALLACFPGSYSHKLDSIRPNKNAPGVSSSEVFFTELFLTGILVFVAFSVGVNPYLPERDEEGKLIDPHEDEPVDRRVTAPLCIGLTLGFLAFLGLASSGGVFNPGITFAPMIMSNTWHDFWLYFAGQYVGGLAGGMLQVFVLYKLG
jgi:glycerol uptake facilitator-like aquaporin